MRKGLTSYALVLATAVLPLAGCGGSDPSYREQVRLDANERFNLVNAQLNYDQARQAFDSGQFDRAMKEVDIAIARSPSQASFHVLRGRILLETHRLEQAVAAFDKARELEPSRADACYFTGVVYERWSNDEAAHEHYIAAFEAEPTNVSYLLAAAESMIALGRYDESRALVESKQEYFENNAALRHLLGQIALLQGDPARAVALFSEARMLDPDDLHLLEELARAQFDAEDFAQSLQSVRLLQDLVDDERPDLRLLEARCLTALGRQQEARELYLELSRTTPTSSDPNVWIELGALAYEIGDDRRVALCGQQLVSIVPHRFEGYLLKGLFESRQGHSKQAIAFMREAVARAGESQLPHLALADELSKAAGTSALTLGGEGAVAPR
jgi:tetratricopeptide (TPR) repeat protein